MDSTKIRVFVFRELVKELNKWCEFEDVPFRFIWFIQATKKAFSGSNSLVFHGQYNKKNYIKLAQGTYTLSSDSIVYVVFLCKSWTNLQVID